MYPAILIGNSTGAYLSLKLASMHPEAVYGVVAMNTPGGLLAAEVESPAARLECVRSRFVCLCLCLSICVCVYDRTHVSCMRQQQRTHSCVCVQTIDDVTSVTHTFMCV